MTGNTFCDDHEWVGPEGQSCPECDATCAHLVPSPAPVSPRQIYEHRNGVRYEVICLANIDSDRPEYPVTVVYRGITNQKVWSRPLADWHRSMTLVPNNVQEPDHA